MVAPSFILLPLYIYPLSTAWSTLIDSLSANPNTRVLAIINPANGPGSSIYPNSDYVSAIASINAYTNVETLCYVHTSWTQRSIADVEADITTCAGWASYVGADIHMDGIFFDEATSIWNASTSSYMSTVTAYAKATMGSNRSTVVFNPGTSTDSRFYSIADYINVFENDGSEYSNSLALAAAPSTYYNQSTIMVYGFSGASSDMSSMVSSLGDVGMAGLFVTAAPTYHTWGSSWSSFSSMMSSS